MNSLNEKGGTVPFGAVVALVGSGVGLGLSLVGLGALLLHRTTKQVQGRSVEVDKYLLSMQARQTETDRQLQADLLVFRQVLTAYQPTPVQEDWEPPYKPAPHFPASILAPPTPEAEAAYAAINRKSPTLVAKHPYSYCAGQDFILPVSAPPTDLLFTDTDLEKYLTDVRQNAANEISYLFGEDA